VPAPSPVPPKLPKLLQLLQLPKLLQLLQLPKLLQLLQLLQPRNKEAVRGTACRLISIQNARTFGEQKVMATEECNHLQKNQDHSGSNVNVRILGYIPRPTACLLREQQVWKEGIQCHMALGHEEFPLDMVQLLLLGTRRCLSC
jgi:hypothetical protein